ncbi:TRAP transporter small permease [Ramlibacter sp. MAHUQ-53]|uniref:TRAP transporter small permease n=1 Tax=unclassified Ramlibacter TaxID=2617605 RepID=UPI00362DE9CD
MLNSLIDKYCRLLGVAMVACLAVMVALVFGNVVLRYAFNSGISLSDELSRWLFVWMTFMGAVVALHEHSHLGTDFLVARLPVWGKKLCLGLGQCLMLFVTWLLFKGALDQVRINLETTSAVMEAPVAWFYGCGVLFAVSAAVVLVLDLWRLLTGQVADKDLIAIRESEEEGLEEFAPEALEKKQ